ncbi:MAG: hypothetical protein QNI91_17595 [Arenicellales bacterium]|nr:hypothetical protein [Arenicellales bacterium]
MNTPKEHFSDEILNAYVDGELAPEDSTRISEAMKTDEILRRRVTDIERISELVRAAFSETSSPIRQSTSPARRYPAIYLWPAAAAVAFFTLTGLLGWHMYDHHVGDATVAAVLAADNKLKQVPTNQIDIAQEAVKVMFHVGRDDATLFNNVLSETDRLLSNYNDPDRPLVIRVIASHGGLSLFRVNLTDNANRVREIKSKHDVRVEFVGCGETFSQWLAKKNEKDTELLPEMLMVDSGVFELLRRQKQGWTLLSI